MSAALKRARAEDISEQAASHFNDPSKAGKLFVPNSASALAQGNNISFRYASLGHAFPDVDPGFRPFGSLVLVQIRVALKQSGSIILTTEDRRTEQDNTQVAKVISMGPLAFHNRNTGEPWPEGAWAQPGDFVRIPKYRGDRFIKEYRHPEMIYEGAVWREGKTIVSDEVTFATFNDLTLMGAYTGDPLLVKAYI